MKKFLYKLLAKFLTAFGDLKIFKYPFWLVYDPDDYQIRGEDVLEIMSILKEGDIILRGYNHYADGKCIPSFPNDKIGSGFSHGAIYVGDNEIIHAVAEGVSYINVLDFLQCDRIAIFRPRKGQKRAIKRAREFVKNDTPYDFLFNLGSSALYCFELCVECYKELKIEPKTITKLFGLIKKPNTYVAQSFVESPDLELVYCKNPKSGIDFVKN